MKRYIFILPIVIILLFVSLIFYFEYTVRFNDKSFGVAKFIYEDIKIETEILSEDLEQLLEVFEGKNFKIESLSCGFTENISVKIDNKTFCIACDTCGVVYILEEDKYFHLSDAENKTVRKILENYGFEFPCI